MTQDINFWKARDLGDIINVTFAFVKTHFKSLLTVLVYTAGPFILLSAILGVWLQSNMIMPTMEDQLEDPFAAFAIFGDFRFYLTLIVGLIGSFILYAAMYSYVMLARDGEEVTVDAVWDRIREDAGIYVTTFLLFLGGYIITIPIIVIPCLGILIWLAGGLYLVTILQIYVPSRLHERTDTFEAIKRCNTLNKGHIVESFLLLIVLIVIIFALGMVFMLPSIAISFTYGLTSLTDQTSIPIWVSLISTISQLAASLITIIPITATILHYCNLVERYESPGLADRIDDWADAESDDSQSGDLY